MSVAAQSIGSLVRAEGLSVHFQVRTGLLRSIPLRAVDDVSLQISAGKTVAVVGESGSGKTTLGRAMLRLVEPTAGQIIFNNEDITRFDAGRLKAFRRRAQVIFQDPYSSISPYMNVHDIVEEPMLIHGPVPPEQREEQIVQALEQVKLTPAREFARKYPHNLSGGQRQRVCIARAIVLNPAFVVADEPVSMVDASNRAEILYLLRELQERHQLAFLYITHDIASARHFSDQTAVMYLGTIVEHGPTEEVIRNPLHPYTRGLLAAVPEPDPKNRNRLREVIPGEPPNATNVPSGCPFHPRCPHFMQGTCEVARPRLLEVAPDHYVACYLYE